MIDPSSLKPSTVRRLRRFEECDQILDRAVAEGKVSRAENGNYLISGQQVSAAMAITLMGHGDKVMAL